MTATRATRATIVLNTDDGGWIVGLEMSCGVAGKWIADPYVNERFRSLRRAVRRARCMVGSEGDVLVSFDSQVASR